MSELPPDLPEEREPDEDAVEKAWHEEQEQRRQDKVDAERRALLEKMKQEQVGAASTSPEALDAEQQALLAKLEAEQSPQKADGKNTGSEPNE